MPNVDPYVEQAVGAALDAIETGDDSDLEARIRQAIVDAADHGAAGREQIVEALLASDCTIEITGCDSCPFADGSCCVHPVATTTRLKPFILRKRGERVPSFCPLLVQQTRIILAR